MFYSESADTLMAFGQKLGEKLVPGTVIVLTGDLGAGKTTLTKGIARGLGIDQMVKSPTYTIARSYEGRLLLHHLDVYRIDGDTDSIDLDEFLYGDAVTVIEWGNLLEEGLLEDYLEIVIVPKGDGRQLTLLGHGPQSQQLVNEVANG
ncbi:tRNA (adenosine(37)-N6)-threonylcarbamoyltransferase complex ATPase subunit type 1 TsaE [Streptococcus sp. DD12]|uniref:tRNA (adenosine(37)-N6)-threonylcarbamoyltransferase complex ATPase subunit type 1 TsaE n=1 Tax=Streptococcus sp. DD12 TaxID=1777880 RepID=UPI000799A105|nr:tRNA (adenosine(37)-N6)-threonylcarbamoyltransferase complex ATPase subunit type 1 TsaE [Streptococcus sp. DD12]KXT75873.1 ATPase YjeE [Streptococcus sp. DD12]